jgi:hypothetical protein
MLPTRIAKFQFNKELTKKKKKPMSINAILILQLK